MRWYNNLYLSEHAPAADKVRRKVEHGAGQIGIYLVTLPSNPENRLDIVPSQELLQRCYPRKDMSVVGIARGREEAMEVAAAILDEVYQATGAFEVTDFLEAHGTFQEGRRTWER